jgi:acetyl esterase/lipase
MIRTLRVVVAALLLVLIPAVAFAQARVEQNVIYGMYSGAALLMDVHHPAAPNGLGIILVPGSGWGADPEYGATGIKDGAQPPIWVPPLTRAGYTVFVPNHRATPAFPYPAPVDDVQRAVRFVRHNATRYRIDGSRLGGMGGSSGGHLIALMGMRDGGGAADDSDPVNRQSAKLQALVVRAAPADLSVPPGLPAIGALMQMSLPAPGRGGSVQRRRYSEASPVSYVTADDPPTLILHGDADQTVPFAQATLFSAALQKAGVPSRLVTIPRGTHGPTFGLAQGAPHPTDWPDYMGEMVRWFDQHLKTGKPTSLD